MLCDFAVVLVLCLPRCEDVVCVTEAEHVEGSQHKVEVFAPISAVVLSHLQSSEVVAVAANHQQISYQRLEGGTFESLGGQLAMTEVGKEDGMVDEEGDGVAEGDEDEGKEDCEWGGRRQESGQVHDDGERDAGCRGVGDVLDSVSAT